LATEVGNRTRGISEWQRLANLPLELLGSWKKFHAFENKILHWYVVEMWIFKPVALEATKVLMLGFCFGFHKGFHLLRVFSGSNNRGSSLSLAKKT